MVVAHRAMHLMYYTNEEGHRVYTLKVPPFPAAAEQCNSAARGAAHAKRAQASDSRLMRTHLFGAQKEAPDGRPTESAHPARFSPDDKFSKQRLICKKRFGLLPMQRPQVAL